jgi:methylase of polypeptide subunit release factors
MKARGGFDVIVGNPPWAKPSWNEGLVLADIDPLYAGLSASDAKKVLGEALPKALPVRREGRTVPAVEAFLQDFVSTRGAMEVTSSEVMNPFAGGGSNNLYRCFIDLSFRLVAPAGYVSLIHPLCQGSCPLLYFSSISQVGGIGRRRGIFTGTKSGCAEADAAATQHGHPAAVAGRRDIGGNAAQVAG